MKTTLEERTRTEGLEPPEPLVSGENLVPDETPAPTPTYYGLPVVKAPKWKAYVPIYLYVGGVAGGAAVLAGVSRFSPALEELSLRSRKLTAIGVPLGTALLVADMGRPSRFLNVLRVFRPTSVVNVGSWLLSACGAASVASVFLPKPAADAALGITAISGAFVATYTGALLSNTAIPLWSRGRRTMPFLFAAASAASTGWILLPGATGTAAVRSLQRLAVAGQIAELALGRVLEREVGPRAAAPLRSPMWTASQALGTAAVLVALTTRTSGGRWIAAALGTAAGLALRFAVHDGGIRSARDPLAVLEPR